MDFENNLVMEDRCQIDEFDAIAEQFFGSVLGMDYANCFVSDESCLSDFVGNGMPTTVAALTEAESLHAFYNTWDKWVISEIAQRYGIEIANTNIAMVDLLNRIAHAKRPTFH